MPGVILAVGLVCSLALSIVVQDATRHTDEANAAAATDAVASQARLRLHGLEMALNAAVALAGVTDPAGPSFATAVTSSVLGQDGAQGLQVTGPGWTITIPANIPAVEAAPVPDTTGGIRASLSADGRLLLLRREAGPWALTLTADADTVFGQNSVIRPAEASGPLPPPGRDGPIARSIAVGDRDWQITYPPSARGPNLPLGLHLEAVLVMLFGMALTLLLAGHARTVQRRAAQTEVLAQGLQDANRDLQSRMAEEERFARAVRDSERRFRDIYENALAGIFTTTPEGRFVSANPATVRILGYDDEADLITAIKDTARQVYVDPACRARLLQQVMATGTLRDFEAEVRRKDGSTIWVEMAVRAIQDDTGKIVAFQATAQDVTDRRLADTALRLAKDQADLANRAKTEFLANMSHELRTPLNAIIGFSEIIGSQSMGPIENEAYAEYARDIHESGRMLLELINDILDLSKIEAGKKEISERAVDVARLVRSSLRLVRERALKGQVDVAAEVPDGLPPLWADEIALKQILSNLLTNAVKFTPQGGSVTAGAELEESGCLCLWVRDTGIGMKPEDIPKALEPFRQIEGSLSRSSGGVGLGLPLVKALVELHDGELSLESALGEGTMARVRLPADRVRSGPGTALPRSRI